MNVHRWFLVFVLIVEALVFSLILFYYSERFVFLFCKIVVSIEIKAASILLGEGNFAILIRTSCCLFESRKTFLAGPF